MIKNKGYQYSKNNRMSLVIKEGWNGLLLGIGTNGLEMRIYNFELNIDPQQKTSIFGLTGMVIESRIGKDWLITS